MVAGINVNSCKAKALPHEGTLALLTVSLPIMPHLSSYSILVGLYFSCKGLPHLAGVCQISVY